MIRISVGRRGVAWTMLGLYGLVVSGLPLPLALPPAASAAARTLAAKDRSRPFPCMDKPCGCDSAERCFSNCCCHTPSETLRWAKARGLAAAVIAALQRRVAAATAALPAAASCCGKDRSATPSCCDSAAADPAPDETLADVTSAGKIVRRDLAGPAAQDDPAVDEPATKVVTLRAMLACGGVITELLGPAAGGSLPPARVICSMLAGPGRHVPCQDEPSLRRPTEPAVPPPRSC